jgi:hypothetical protein
MVSRPSLISKWPQLADPKEERSGGNFNIALAKRPAIR